jgi:hypothetical protein
MDLWDLPYFGVYRRVRAYKSKNRRDHPANSRRNNYIRGGRLTADDVVTLFEGDLSFFQN